MPQIRYKVTLTGAERQKLRAMATRGKHRSQSLLNALILLACDEASPGRKKRTAKEISNVLPVSLRKIDRVKRRFVESGLEAAVAKRLGGRHYVRKADRDFEKHLLVLAGSQPPKGYKRWSLRLLADEMVELGYTESVSYETVRRVLKRVHDRDQQNDTQSVIHEEPPDGCC